MKFITLVTAVAAVVTAAYGLTINTPSNVVECEPTQFAWSGGVGPYYLSLVPAGQPSATPFEQFPSQTGTSYTWTVTLGSGTSFTIALKDSTGSVAYSDIVTVQAGSSSSCLNSTSQGTTTGGSGATSTGSSGSTTGGSGAASTGSSGSSPAGTTAAAGASSGSATATSSSSTSTKSSSAGRLGVSSAFGVAGIMGLVGAALL